MAVSYKRLWKVLIDEDMKKKDLEMVANVSYYTLNKMTKGEHLTFSGYDTRRNHGNPAGRTKAGRNFIKN